MIYAGTWYHVVLEIIGGRTTRSRYATCIGGRHSGAEKETAAATTTATVNKRACVSSKNRKRIVCNTRKTTNSKVNKMCVRT